MEREDLLAAQQQPPPEWRPRILLTLIRAAGSWMGWGDVDGADYFRREIGK